MPFLYSINIIINDDSENLDLQNEIDDIAEKAFSNQSNVEIVSTTITELDNTICSECCKCGVWVSDKETCTSVSQFSDGCIIDGKWYCDLCLPADHPKAF